VLPRTGTDVDDVVGRCDRRLVVFHHDQGVAEVAQPQQGLDQPLVVALVQADRRLVQDVEHPDEAGTDLGREPDPLGLAAGQRPRRPVEGEVLEPDVQQEPQPGADLLEHPGADQRVALGELEVAHERVDLGDRQPVKEAMSDPPTVTPSTIGFSRRPSQLGHGTSRMYCSTCDRT
jgi:hypothetical protein